jgi:zinc protease
MQLLGEGTKRLDKASFAEKQADHAITVWANGGMETSTVGVRGLKRQLGPALDLLSELLREPGLRQEDLDRLRDRRKAQLAQSKATPAAIARRLYPALVFGAKHPYGRLESDASLAAITVADCRKVAARLAPDGARLFAVGMLTRAELEDEFAQRFGRWKGPAPRARRIPKPTPRKGQIVFVHAPEANQSQVWLGHPGPPRAAADYEATEVMAQILGGGFTSRINMNLREVKGFSYGGSGGIQYNKGASYFAAQSSVRADATAAAMREMVAEIRTMRRSDPTQEEIGREVEGRLLALPANFASATRSASSFQALVFHGLALDWYTHYQDRLKQVDIPGVRAAAEKHLRDEGLTVLVVGDATVVLEDLETLAKEGVFGTGGLRIVDADGKSVLAPAAAGEKSEATHPRTPDEATAKPSKSAR